MKDYNPPVPFPQRLQKEKLEEQFSKFLNMFKKIEINIPFLEALTQMPHYAKFLKDPLSKKRKFTEEGIVSLNATNSAIIQKSILEKGRIQAASDTPPPLLEGGVPATPQNPQPLLPMTRESCEVKSCCL